MKKKMYSFVLLLIAFSLVFACSPAAPSGDPAAPYYPTYTAIAQGLIDMSNTATAQAALPPSATPLPVGGTENVKQDDGSTKYTDYDAGFELVVPAGWVSVRPGEQEFEDTLANEGSQNQALADQMNADMETYEAGTDRLYIYAVKPEITDYLLQGFGKVAWDQDDPRQMDNAALQELTQSLPAAIAGLRIVSSNITPNQNGVPVLSLGGKFTLNNASGEPITFFMNVVMFKPDANSTVRLTATYLDVYRNELDKDFNSIVDSIVLLK